MSNDYDQRWANAVKWAEANNMDDAEQFAAYVEDNNLHDVDYETVVKWFAFGYKTANGEALDPMPWHDGYYRSAVLTGREEGNVFKFSPRPAFSQDRKNYS